MKSSENLSIEDKFKKATNVLLKIWWFLVFMLWWLAIFIIFVFILPYIQSFLVSLFLLVFSLLSLGTLILIYLYRLEEKQQISILWRFYTLITFFIIIGIELVIMILLIV